MRVAVISGQECLVSEVEQSVGKSGLGLWFLDSRTGGPDLNRDTLEAVALFTRASSQDWPARENPDQRGCSPFDCASCEGAALCGGHATIN